MFFVHHPLKLTQSLNVASTMIVPQKWPAFKNVARIRVCRPIRASRENNVMSYPHHLGGPLLHAPALMDSCPTTKDTAYQLKPRLSVTRTMSAKIERFVTWAVVSLHADSKHVVRMPNALREITSPRVPACMVTRETHNQHATHLE